MHSSKNHPLHTVGKNWYVWYMADWFNRAYYDGNNPTARNGRIESLHGKVVGSRWIESNQYGKPYGWLVTIQLEDGSYRSLYECKCQMISGIPLEVSPA